MRYSTATVLAALAACSSAHSWIDQLTLIDNDGKFTGTPGYPRAYVDRKAPGFTDKKLVHLLPHSDPLEARDASNFNIKGIAPNDHMCRKSQLTPTQAPGFPRLSASPGSMIALRYQENGHVTLPQNSVRKPENRGDVYIYGTSEPKENENFLDVFKKWTTDGTGGDKRGRLLAKQNYDDGRCYQTNPQQISQQRQKQFPHAGDQLMGMDLWCQNDIKLPKDIPAGKPYTIYWVWDWPTLPGPGPVPEGKAEIYTTCMDVDIKAGPKRRTIHEIRAEKGQALNNMAIPEYVSSMKSAPSPAPQSAPPAKPATPAQSAPPAKPAPPASSSAPAAAVSPSTRAAEDVVLSAMGPKLVNEIASKLTASLNAKPTAPIAANNPKDITSTMDAGTVTKPTIVGTATANAPMGVASSMPASLQFATPMMGPSSSSAPAPAPPAASVNLQPSFSGTATPAIASGDTAGKRSCDGNCRKSRRSRIFQT